MLIVLPVTGCVLHGIPADEKVLCHHVIGLILIDNFEAATGRAGTTVFGLAELRDLMALLEARHGVLEEFFGVAIGKLAKGAKGIRAGGVDAVDALSIVESGAVGLVRKPDPVGIAAKVVDDDGMFGDVWDDGMLEHLGAVGDHERGVGVDLVLLGLVDSGLNESPSVRVLHGTMAKRIGIGSEFPDARKARF